MTLKKPLQRYLSVCTVSSVLHGSCLISISIEATRMISLCPALPSVAARLLQQKLSKQSLLLEQPLCTTLSSSLYARIAPLRFRAVLLAVADTLCMPHSGLGPCFHIHDVSRIKLVPCSFLCFLSVVAYPLVGSHVTVQFSRRMVFASRPYSASIVCLHSCGPASLCLCL